MQIKNFAQIEYIGNFELTKHESEHSRLKFSASISDGAAEKFLVCTGKNISVTTDDNAPIFFGRVESVEVEKSIDAAKVFVTCVSLSINSDEEIKTRIFHDPDKKILDVLNSARLSLQNANLKVADDFSTLKYFPVILQNQETNFQFIARISKNFGRRFWILDTMEQTKFFIDSCINKSARKISDTQILSVRQSKIGKKYKIFLKLQNFFDIGQVVMIENITGEFVITGLKVSLENESYFFYYEIEELKMDPPKIPDVPILTKTLKLHAKVKSNKDPKNLGRIQVNFDDKFVEDVDGKNPLWLDYRTPYSGKNGGIVFIPDEGDAVEVIFSNEEIFCVSAIRENSLAAECQNVSEKYIGNNFNQRIFFKEKSLEFVSDKYKIVMNEKGIEISVGENSVTLNEQGILMQTKDSRFSISKDIAVQSGDKMKIDGKEISVESNGAANVKSGGTLKLAGNKIELC